MIPKIPINEKELGVTIADLSASFAEYPLCRWVIGAGKGSEYARLKLFNSMVRYLAMPGGKVCRPAQGGAAAIWIPSEHVRESFIGNAQLAASLLGRLSLQQFTRAAQVHKVMGRHHPHEALHCYLFLIGVRSEFQGRGIGSQLLKDGLEQVDAQKRGAFLETSSERAIELYRRFGFKLVEKYHIRPDSPSTWTMWRPARDR